MNYDATKKLGFLMNAIATHMLSNDDVYQAVATLPRECFEYYSISAKAFIEISATIEHELDLAAHLVDKYIMTEETTNFFPWHLILDGRAKSDFIDKDLGDEFALLSRVSIDILSMDSITHPDKYEKGYLAVACDEFKVRLENSGIDNPNLKLLINYIDEKKKSLDSAGDIQEDIQKGNKKGIKKDIKRDEDKQFEIKDDYQCLAVLHYLKDTGVLDEHTQLSLFVESITAADMSRIKPLLIDKYRMAVARMVSMIKHKPYKWQKLACASLGVDASYALGNVTKNAEWDEGLCKILPKVRGKKT